MDWQTALVTCAGILLAAVVIWQVMETGRVAVIHGIRKEIAVEVQKENQEVLDEIRTALAEVSAGQRELAENVTDVRARIAAIEKLLREVG